MKEAQDINHDKLMELFGNVFSHISGAVGLLMSYLEIKTGLYSKIEEMGSCTAKSSSDVNRHGRKIFARNGCQPMPYRPYHFEAETSEFFYLSPEQAVVFCEKESLNALNN